MLEPDCRSITFFVIVVVLLVAMAVTLAYMFIYKDRCTALLDSQERNLESIQKAVTIPTSVSNTVGMANTVAMMAQQNASTSKRGVGKVKATTAPPPVYESYPGASDGVIEKMKAMSS